MDYSKEFTKIKNDILEYKNKTGFYPRKIYMTEELYERLSSQADEITLTVKQSKPYNTIFGVYIEIVYDYKLR